MAEEGTDERLDVYIASRYAKFTRSFVKTLILHGFVRINGHAPKPAYKVEKGDVVEITVPEPEPLANEPQDIPLNIVYQDDDIAVVDKQRGLVVHPAAGNPDGTLVNALLYHVGGLSGINGALRPGIVHRLDKDTSGLIVIAKNDRAHKELARQIKDKTAGRTYLAIVHGNIREDGGTINAPIGRHKTERKMMAVVPDGREAVTYFTVLERFGDFTLVEARLATGRTHQIRVHFKHMGHPVAGDPLYGPKKAVLSAKGQLLHAWRLKLIHPATGEEMTFEAPLDAEFARALAALRKPKKSEG